MKKNSRLFDELAFLLPKLEVEAMLLEGVRDTASVEAILQLTHAVVIERGAVDRVGHGRLGANYHICRLIPDRRSSATARQASQ
jgi:hypothetical protein